jgi:hypothetical protein
MSFYRDHHLSKPNVIISRNELLDWIDLRLRELNATTGSPFINHAKKTTLHDVVRFVEQMKDQTP